MQQTYQNGEYLAQQKANTETNKKKLDSALVVPTSSHHQISQRKVERYSFQNLTPFYLPFRKQ